MRQVAAVLFAFLVATGAVWAQGDISLGTPVERSPVLTLDQDRFFNESMIGVRLRAENEKERTGLAAENRQIEAELFQAASEVQRPVGHKLEPTEIGRRFERRIGREGS